MGNSVSESVKRVCSAALDALHPRRIGGPLDLQVAERKREERLAAHNARLRADAEQERQEDEAALSYFRDRLALLRRDHRPE